MERRSNSVGVQRLVEENWEARDGDEAAQIRHLREKLEVLSARMQRQQVKLERKVLVLQAHLASEEERKAMAEPSCGIQEGSPSREPGSGVR